MSINTTFSLAGPLTPGQKELVEQANQLRERAQSVKQSLESAPSDKVTLDKHNNNERLGLYDYKGQIGSDKFTAANGSFRDGKLDAFAAHDPEAAPGTTIKFHTSTSQATGMRATIASAFAGISGGLGHAAAWFMAQAWTTQNRIGANLLVVASKPFEFGSDLARFAESRIGDPGTRDELYAQASSNGDYDQFVFTASGDLEVLKTNHPRS